MILDFLRKPIQLKHFLIFILLSPIIIVILSVIVSVLEPSDIPSLKEKPYECGILSKVRSCKLKFPRKTSENMRQSEIKLYKGCLKLAGLFFSKTK